MPQVLAVYAREFNDGGGHYVKAMYGSSSSVSGTVWITPTSIFPLEMTQGFCIGYDSSSFKSASYACKSSDEKTITWCGRTGNGDVERAEHQFNALNVVYHYFAIG